MNGPVITPSDEKLLEIVLNYLVISEGRLFEHIFTTFRWLLATLFAANGGAIVALVSASQPTSNALPWFASGLVLSIVMGILSCIISYRMFELINAARIEIEQMFVDGVKREAALGALAARGRPTWKTFIPSYVGVASLLCLIAGMVAAGGT